MSKAEEIFYYHERTKHQPYRYAPSLGYLDWAEQPNPFRFFEGASKIALPRDLSDPLPKFSELYSSISPRPLDKNSLSQFFLLSMGLSAWKAIGQNSWALRINPSSGNLHPTEAHVWLPNLKDFTGGCFHYTPLLHALETRHDGPLSTTPSTGFIVGLSSIYWRESWKYGERGFRYCQHDVGHAISALSFAARIFGWKINRLPLSDSEFEFLFGFNQIKWIETEEEKPDLALWVSGLEEIPSREATTSWINEAEKLVFLGTPNPLSKSPLKWEEIDKVSLASKRESENIVEVIPQNGNLISSNYPVEKLAADIIRGRRSAVDFDGHTTISKSTFLAMLQHTLATQTNPAFPDNLKDSQVNLFLFVHRVEGLPPGLYCYLRTEDIEYQKANLNPDFLWQQVSLESPLYLLKEGDFQAEAKGVSCNQDIAGMGAFSLGMVARFEKNINERPHSYRELFWETGMIGQALYLNAEAFLVRATGIGCFFDDSMHAVLGIKDHQEQSLYHLSVGGPVEDARLTTLPPYSHLE